MRVTLIFTCNYMLPFSFLYIEAYISSFRASKAKFNKQLITLFTMLICLKKENVTTDSGF